MNLANGTSTGVGLGLDHNEQWNNNYSAPVLRSHMTSSSNLRLYSNQPPQFNTRTSSRMTPSPTDLTPASRPFVSFERNPATLPAGFSHHATLPQRSVSEQQYRPDVESPYTRSLARPSDASRLRALGANASPLLSHGGGTFRSSSEEYKQSPPENFSRPRRKNSVQSSVSSRESDSPRPGLHASNTFPAAPPQSHTEQNNSSTFPVETRQRGTSSSSSIASSYVALPLRPSQSIPDYGIADSIHTSQRNIAAPHLSLYRPAQRTANLRKRDPPRSTPEPHEELRTSFRSALTTVSSTHDTTATERSSVITTASSKTSVFGQEGMSVDDALDMYANGFQDSGQSDDEYNTRSSTSHSQRGTQIKMAEARLGAESSSATQPHPLQSEILVPMEVQTIVRDSHAIFSQHLHPDSMEDYQVDRMAVTPTSTERAESAYSPSSKTSKPSILYSTTSLIGLVDRPQELINSRGLHVQTPSTFDDSRDIYGFKKASQYVTRKEYDKWNNEYTEYLQRRKHKWAQLLKDAGLPIENPTLFPPKSNKIKRYIRKGIPHKLRGAAWFHYGGGTTMLANNPRVYDSLLKRAKTTDLKPECDEQIERDLHRTFPDNILFKPDVEISRPSTARSKDAIDAQALPPVETAILRSLRRVLQAFSIYAPKIGYCQSLNFIAGLLLLFISDEEKAFWMLVIVTHVYLPGTHEVSLEGANVDLGVLMICVQDSLPRIWDKIGGELDGSDFHKDKHSMRLPPITLCCTSWFMSCFVGSLPIETTLRVWDSFFYEGSKTMFRIALAIFKHGEMEIRAVKDGMEIFQTVQTIPRRILDANGLLEACFKKRNGFGHLSQMTIEKRRQDQRDGYANEKAINNGEVLVRKNTLFNRKRSRTVRIPASEATIGKSKEV